MDIHEKLLIIQSKLKTGKQNFNKFGKYNYRTLDDIYEAVKPLLVETNTVLTIDDSIEVIGNVLFRKSTAYLRDTESKDRIDCVTATMFTQEALNKPGMSTEQCSGSTSSYSNKYVLGKLFCIDDTDDADTTNNHSTKPSTSKNSIDELKLTIAKTLDHKVEDEKFYENCIDYLKTERSEKELKTLLTRIERFVKEGK